MVQPERWKRYAYQKETTGTSNDSLQLCPFSKWELLLKEKNLLPERVNSFIKSSSLWYRKSLLPH